MGIFTLTEAHLKSFLDPVSATPPDWLPFLGAIDPEVKWTIGSEVKDKKSNTGVYNLASWMAEVAPAAAKLDQQGLKMKISSMDIVPGNKAIVEAYAEATQKIGRPYNNRLELVYRSSDKNFQKF
ncbi:hypothetical protein MVEN_00193600 [Mycena venus]|uniref:Uncharacterized protein n=1 Tax=Mycena venus TaxID=2733690 RepID=A0A8H6Z2I5_9AGAR|nr:hypothetical protein MVEN_00193600 [Mycena venus]